MVHQRQRLSEENVATVIWRFGNRTPLEILREMVRDLCPERGVPNSVTQGKDMLRGVYIHIADYARGDFTLLPDMAALRRRCREIGCFPRKRAKTEGLKFLLRKLGA